MHPCILCMESYLILVPEMVHSHMFVHVQVIRVVPDPGQITPDEVPVFITGRQTQQVAFKVAITAKKRKQNDQQDDPTHSLASTQPGRWYKTSSAMLSVLHL